MSYLKLLEGKPSLWTWCYIVVVVKISELCENKLLAAALLRIRVGPKMPVLLISVRLYTADISIDCSASSWGVHPPKNSSRTTNRMMRRHLVCGTCSFSTWVQAFWPRDMARIVHVRANEVPVELSSVSWVTPRYRVCFDAVSQSVIGVSQRPSVALPPNQLKS